MTRRFCFFLCMLGAAVVYAGPALAGVWYVDAAAAAGGAGTGWASPFKTLQQAVDASSAGDEIWVKKGTYLLSAQVLVDERVSLYGGFAGTETLRTQRNPTLNLTKIDGNNSVRCLYVNVNNVVIDGFTITRGVTAGTDRGAALFNTVAGSGTNTTVSNCTFTYNHCPGNSGGAVYNEQGRMTISGCTFQGNTSNNRGGAIYVYYSSSLSFGTAVITDCDFLQNTSGSGGALFFKGGTGAGPNSITACLFQANNAYSDAGSNDGGAIVCDPTTTITRCSFLNNTATRYGTVVSYGDAGTTLTVTSSLFAGNSVHYGAAISINGTSGYLGSVIVTHCTFSGNTASGSGGALYNLKSLGGSSVFQVTNSILWNNSPNEIAVGGSGGLPTVRYCDVNQDGYAGSNGNIRQTPGFLGPANFHLTAASPCLDAGTNSAPSMPSQDIDGDLRIIDGDENGTATADMGADEFSPAGPGWGAASTMPQGCSGHHTGGSLILNVLSMIVLPVGVFCMLAAARRREG